MSNKRSKRRLRGKAALHQINSLKSEIGSFENRLNSALRDKSNAYRAGREDGLRDMLRNISEQEGMMKYFLRGAHEKLGEHIGEQIGFEMKRHDPVFQQKRRIVDSMLSLASRSLAYDARASFLDEETIFKLKIKMPEAYRCFAITL